MTVKHTFYVGLNDKDAHVQIIDTLAAAKIVQNVFIKHNVDGATITGGKGIYKHNDGTVVCEETVIVTVFDFSESVPVKSICEDLKAMLNQESVAVESTETNSVLY